MSATPIHDTVEVYHNNTVRVAEELGKLRQLNKILLLLNEAYPNPTPTEKRMLKLVMDSYDVGK